MCESKLILKNADGNEEILMEEVVSLVPTENGLKVRTILGQEREFEYELVEISLISHKIFLRER